MSDDECRPVQPCDRMRDRKRFARPGRAEQSDMLFPFVHFLDELFDRLRLISLRFEFGHQLKFFILEHDRAQCNTPR